MGHPSILLVDDDPDALVLTSSILSMEGYQVASAVDVAQALEVARVRPPDVVLLDYDLPVEDGLSALDKLRQSPACRRAAVILVTAYRFTADEVQNVEGYVRKPWEPQELIAAIEKAAQTRQAVGS